MAETINLCLAVGSVADHRSLVLQNVLAAGMGCSYSAKLHNTSNHAHHSKRCGIHDTASYIEVPSVWQERARQATFSILLVPHNAEHVPTVGVFSDTDSVIPQEAA